jgi:hypothetical protein
MAFYPSSVAGLVDEKVSGPDVIGVALSAAAIPGLHPGCNGGVRDDLPAVTLAAL